MKIPHALCDLGSSINIIPLKKFKELKIGEVTPSNMTLTLMDSSITRPIGIIQDILVHVYEWASYMEDLDTCYQVEEKGSKVHKGMTSCDFTDVRVSLVPDVF